MTKRYIDLSVTVDDRTMSPPSTNLRLEVTPHRRGPGFWQVSSVHQSLHTGAHIDSPLHVFSDGITTAEISLDQVMGEAIVVDLSFAGTNHKITIDDLKRGARRSRRSGWSPRGRRTSGSISSRSTARACPSSRPRISRCTG